MSKVKRPSKVQKLWTQFQELTPEEQQQFKSRLGDAEFPDPPGEDLSPEEWERVWGEEIARRVERYERGVTKARDAFEALEDIRKKLRQRRRK
jgi:hypothetical protein